MFILFLKGVALDRRFGFAGAAAALMLLQVQVLALDRRFVWRHARDGIRLCDIVSRQG